MACRVNKKRLWTHRIMLEQIYTSQNGGVSLFLTLTYNKENLPDDLSVHRDHLQRYLKRLRKRLAPLQIRYYGVGEYGDKSWRPHYHLALFIVGANNDSITHAIRDLIHDSITDSWNLGFVHIGRLTAQSAGYIAGYVTKKMTNKKDDRLNGRNPEFSAMSLKPGIGALAAPAIVDVLTGNFTMPKKWVKLVMFLLAFFMVVSIYLSADIFGASLEKLMASLR